ncbi:MAG: hypothetical protein RR922_02350 [Clostridia bacterium]
MDKKDSISRLLDVLEQTLETKIKYQRYIALMFPPQIPVDILDELIKYMRPNMEVTYLEDPMDLDYVLKNKEIVTFIKGKTDNEVIQKTVTDKISILSKTKVTIGSYKSFGKDVKENEYPSFGIGIPHIVKREQSISYKLYETQDKGMPKLIKEENIKALDKIYLYVPNILMFKPYYDELKIRAEKKEMKQKIAFLEFLKKLLKEKVNTQARVLAMLPDLPYKIIDEVVTAAIYKGDSPIYIIDKPADMARQLANKHIKSVFLETMGIEEKDNKYKMCTLDTKIEVVTKAKVKIGNTVRIFNKVDEELNESSSFNYKSYLVFREKVKTQEETVMIVNNKIKTISARTSYTSAIFIYLPSLEYFSEYEDILAKQKEEHINKLKAKIRNKK